MIDKDSFNPDINQHLIPFRSMKRERSESFNLVLYKYIPLKYVLSMFKMR